MSGIRLWRCSRCCDQEAVVALDATRLFCGDCFYRQTVERVMAAAFVSSDEPPPKRRHPVTEERPQAASR